MGAPHLLLKRGKLYVEEREAKRLHNDGNLMGVCAKKTESPNGWWRQSKKQVFTKMKKNDSKYDETR